MKPWIKASLSVWLNNNLLCIYGLAVRIDGCGGVKTVLGNHKHGFIDNWLSNIKDIHHRHEEKFKPLKTEVERIDLLCELNVVEQVKSVCHTTIIQDAWDREQELAVHGWIYGINNGLLKDLNACISAKNQIHEIYRVNR